MRRTSDLLIGEYLKECRVSANVKQREIAKLAKVNIQFISSVERNLKPPPPDLMTVYVSACKIPKAEFLRVVQTKREEWIRQYVFKPMEDSAN